MKRNRFTVEAIIRMLLEAEVHLSHGKSIAQMSRDLGITARTYYRWRINPVFQRRMVADFYQ